MEHMDVLVEQADMDGALAVPNEAAHAVVSSYVEGLLSYLQSMRGLSPAHPRCVSGFRLAILLQLFEILDR